MRLNLPSLSASPPTTEHADDPLGASDYIQVDPHNHAADELDGSIDQDHEDPFQNIATPASLVPADHGFEPETATRNHPQPSPDFPQLDLSCVNSDDTDASLTSLFSFPDPLGSIDLIIPNTPPDQYHPSHWFSPPTHHQLPSSSPHSDQHTSLSSDLLDFNSSRSPSLTDADLHSHPSSFASPTSPTFPSTPGADLSHRLHLYLCGHQISHSQSLQILSNLRMNFTSHLHFPTLNPTCPTSRAPPSSQPSPPLSQARFRQAVTRALSDSPPPNSHTADLIYHTSWLEINLSDLTALPVHDQHSFLSSAPETPALIIHTTASPDCFPIDWLSELSRACPAHLNLFKVLPILLDEKNTSILQALVHGFHAILGLKPNKPLAVKSSTSEPLMTCHSRPPTSLLLQQDTPESMPDRLLRPHDLAMLSAPSVAKLQQLLIPIEPSTEPDQTSLPSSSSPPPPPPPSAGNSKFLAALACLVAVAAALALVSQPQAFGHQSTMSAAESSLCVSTVERANVTPETSEQSLITKGLGDRVEPTQAPRENVNTSANDLPSTFPTVNQESTVGQKEIGGNDQSIDTAYPDQPAVSEEEFNMTGPRTILADPNETGDEQQQPGRKRFRESLRTALPLVSTRDRAARAARRLKNSSIYNASKFKTFFSVADISRSHPRFSPLELHLKPTQIKLWSTRLPPRLRKGLRNLRSHPTLCLKHLCKTSLPSSLAPSTCDIHH